VFGYVGANAKAEDRAISAAVGTYWTNFAKTGSPGGDPAWPRFSAEGKKFLEFPAVGSEVKVAEDPGGEVCRVLSGDALVGAR
jgi:para-nitrobenzyl esterase